MVPFGSAVMSLTNHAFHGKASAVNSEPCVSAFRVGKKTQSRELHATSSAQWFWRNQHDPSLPDGGPQFLQLCAQCLDLFQDLTCFIVDCLPVGIGFCLVLLLHGGNDNTDEEV